VAGSEHLVLRLMMCLRSWTICLRSRLDLVPETCISENGGTAWSADLWSALPSGRPEVGGPSRINAFLI
jgi:hypothetical protein